MIIGDRSPVFETVRNWCGEAQCEDGQVGAWQPLGERTNDVDVSIVGPTLNLALFGGLGLGVEANPVGADAALFDFDFTGEEVEAGRFCGSADVRVRVQEGEVLEARVPVRLQFIGEWFPFGPQFDDIAGCGPD